MAEVMAAVKCCAPGGDADCEHCPYFPAGDQCGNEMYPDLLAMCDDVSESMNWMWKAFSWMEREQPDVLMAMVERIGEAPEVLR